MYVELHDMGVYIKFSWHRLWREETIFRKVTIGKYNKRNKIGKFVSKFQFYD